MSKKHFQNRSLCLLLTLLLCTGVRAQTATCTLLRSARVFDGETFHEGKAVLIQDDRIVDERTEFSLLLHNF